MQTSKLDAHCQEHDWHFESGDTCPVCKGAADEREKIARMLLEEADDCQCSISTTVRWAAAKVGGEQFEQRCHGCDYILPDLKLEWINGEDLVMVCVECWNQDSWDESKNND
jgi:hypothetical protein